MSSTLSVIISCAGIGSRLGLGTTKALVMIEGKSLIAWQLSLFQDIQDIRIVVGFQSQEVINEVLQYRKDAIFVYNHDYFTTKTGASFYLGARHANQYTLAYDGDLLVHPEDMKSLLEQDGEYIAYSDFSSEDGVAVHVDTQGNVLSFVHGKGDFEWTGPACIKKEHVQYTTENVYNQLEAHLPMRGIKIRACDIDTYADYERAREYIRRWYI